MVREKECLDCKQHFQVSTMVKSSKTNQYGDKEIHGYLCVRCYRNRVEKRSKILFFFTVGTGIIGLSFFGLISYMYLFVKTLLAEQFISTVETFAALGIIFILFSFVMFYIRYKELSKMRNQTRNPH